MEYQIIEVSDTTILQDVVNDEIANGWVPIGGVSVSLCETDIDRYFVCCQAMIKEVAK